MSLSGSLASSLQDPVDSREAKWRVEAAVYDLLLIYLCRDVSFIDYLLIRQESGISYILSFIYSSFIYLLGGGDAVVGRFQLQGTRLEAVFRTHMRCNAILSLHLFGARPQINARTMLSLHLLYCYYIH